MAAIATSGIVPKLFATIAKISGWPSALVTYPASDRTLASVPDLARALPSAAVPFMRVASVPSRPAMGSEASNGERRRSSWLMCVNRVTSVWHEADLEDLAVTRSLFTLLKPEVVYHLAGAVGANPDLGLVVPTFHSLLTSTVNVLVAASEAGCRRIVLTGSLTEPAGIDGAATPHSPYAAAKWAASGYGRMFHELYGAPVVILRLFMTYGPGQAPSKLIQRSRFRSCAASGLSSQAARHAPIGSTSAMWSRALLPLRPHPESKAKPSISALESSPA